MIQGEYSWREYKANHRYHQLQQGQRDPTNFGRYKWQQYCYYSRTDKSIKMAGVLDIPPPPERDGCVIWNSSSESSESVSAHPILLLLLTDFSRFWNTHTLSLFVLLSPLFVVVFVGGSTITTFRRIYEDSWGMCECERRIVSRGSISSLYMSFFGSLIKSPA